MPLMMPMSSTLFLSRNMKALWSQCRRLDWDIGNEMGLMILTMGRKLHTTLSNKKIIPSNLKGKSSQEWMTRHLNDPYVKKAQELNYRARSAFKLIEIDEKAKILKPGLTVIECGAAPGAWTQVIVNRINSDGKAPKKKVGTVIGIDLLPIAPLKGAVLLGGSDFTDPKTLQRIREILMRRHENIEAPKKVNAEHEEKSPENKEGIVTSNGDPTYPQPTVPIHNDDPHDKTDNLLVHVVLSDMAPNATGQKETDHYRIVKLVESALQFALEHGKPGGHFLAKIWDGREIQRVEQLVSKYYDKVSRQKPPSSRNDSSEIFILGKFKK